MFGTADAATPSAAAPSVITAAGAPSFTDGSGIHVVSQQNLDGRDLSLNIVPAALGRQVNVRVLLPSGYGANPQSRYPTLYLFPGTNGAGSDWVNSGNAEATTAGQGLITVMPDIGFRNPDGTPDGGSYFTNWVDTHTPLGPSAWETYHINELIPWIDGNLRTIATRNGRAVAGLSQGGYGAFAYAARHPDMFVSAGSFSGAPDIDYNPLIAIGATAVIEYTANQLDGVEPEAMFGSRLTNESNWQAHDPADLAGNLRGIDLELYTGNGIPGPLDSGPPNLGASGVEAMTFASTMSFAQRASSLGVPYHLNYYGNGTHTWPYWSRDFAQYMVPLMNTFAHPPSTAVTRRA